MKQITICVDFDGTIVKHDFPEVGEPIPNAIECLREYQKRGYKIILNTMRGRGIVDGEFRDTLKEAVDYLKSMGIELYGVNNNPTQKNWTNSPKVYGNFYIDDAAIGCPLIYPYRARPYVDWVEVNKILEQRIKEDSGTK
jgi:hypothetical protein